MSKAIGSIVKIEKDIQVTKVLSGKNKVIKAGTTTVVNTDGDLFGFDWYRAKYNSESRI